MERMARMGLGIVQPAVGLSVLAHVLAGAWTPGVLPLQQRALFVGELAWPKAPLCPCIFILLLL